MGNILVSLLLCPGNHPSSSIATDLSRRGHFVCCSFCIRKKHGERQSPVLSYGSIGEEPGARGHSRRWEGLFNSIEHATARLKLSSPQPIRCCSATVCLLSLGARESGPHGLDGRPIPIAPVNNRRNRTPILKLATWNVRTMLTGISDDLNEIEDTRKTAIINNELARLQIDIAALQETRLLESGTLKESDYTFYWKGKAPGEVREHGVGFAVRNSLVNTIVMDSDGSERLLTLQLNTSSGLVTLLCVYSPTLGAAMEIKDRFYDALSAKIENVPANHHLVVLGDFNARIGADHETWPSCIGHFGTGKLNENGQRLLEACTFHNLCVSNSYFPTKPQHKVSWRHPRSKHWHQLDLILIRRPLMKHVLLTRSYQSADCDTDHSLVVCKVRLKPKKFHHVRRAGKPRINTGNMRHPNLVEQFSNCLSEKTNSLPDTSSEDLWSKLKEAMHEAAMETFGQKTHRSSDWYEAKSHILEPLIEKKRAALMAYKQDPSHRNLTVLKSARSLVQREARRCANDYWTELSENIQSAAASGNVKKMYEGIKMALGPRKNKSAPIKSATGVVLTDKSQVMERWVEHYSELYSRQNLVAEHVLEAAEDLPTMSELDDEPSLTELRKAVDSLTSGKAPGTDGIPPDLIKQCKTSLLPHLYNLLIKCWREGHIPQDMRDAKIITLYKNKGERSDCNNYRGISLLSVVGKLFAKVLLVRLQRLAERIYPESQCGFRPQRSTMDMIFSVRQLQERCREQQRPLHIAFIDLTKAFDLVSRDGLFKLLPKIGCPPRLLELLLSFHADMKGTVEFDGQSSEAFAITSGVKQGCVLAPTLFGIFFALLLRHAFKNSTEGVLLHTRSDGHLFNISRLRAKTRVREVLIRDMLFADDAAFVAHSQEELQLLLDRFSNACKDFSLTISLSKTQILTVNSSNNPNLTIDNFILNAVESFTYLGSTVTQNLSLDQELDKRIGKASTTLSQLTKRVWKNQKLTTATKMEVYKACVLSTLLYGSETWVTYARQEKRLNTFHLRCLRRILGIQWQDHTTNNNVLTLARQPSMYTLLRQRRLRWLGHVRRMQDGRIPKDILYGQLATGKRPTGRPRLRFSDVVKRDMKALQMNHTSWEALAADRLTWRSVMTTGLALGEDQIRQAADERRARRHNPTPPDSVFLCTKCNRACRSRIGLHSHQRKCRNT